MSDKIVKAAIYPALGIARVGNAPGAQDYFLGPEKPGPHPRDEKDFRDSKLRIKRQAQRFRVYGLNAIGEVVRELTSDDADISWKVEIANKKAAWYQFSQALDIPASKGEIKARINASRSRMAGREVRGSISSARNCIPASCRSGTILRRCGRARTRMAIESSG